MNVIKVRECNEVSPQVQVHKFPVLLLGGVLSSAVTYPMNTGEDR